MILGALWVLLIVALRKESVDRNKVTEAEFFSIGQSLSARRAWIEIKNRKRRSENRKVALRKESVDRNLKKSIDKYVYVWSLSARRAWIEMVDYVIDYVNDAVALRKESVDRNDTVQVVVVVMDGRSPQGERG